MKILFSNCVASTKTFNDLFGRLETKPETSIQNYFQLLYRGLKDNEAEIYTFCERQIANSEKGLFLSGRKDEDECGKYYYIPKLLIPGLGQLFSLVVNFILAIRLFFQFRPDYVICDVMRFYISFPTRMVARMFRKPVIGYVADIPQMYHHQTVENSSLKLRTIKSVYSWATSKYDAYVLLSPFMNEKVNPNNKPFIIIEGLVANMAMKEPLKKANHNKTIFMYAGGLYEKYGVKMLIDAVLSADDSVELWLFGKGDQEEYLKDVHCDRISFWGYQPRDYVVAKQKEADFLINPRPSHEEFTKYSFPSKIMEYMLSGTPVISTRIKSIPQEYFDYIIPINNESVTGVLDTIVRCSNMSVDEKSKLGQKSSRFVSYNKNSSKQGERLVDWLKTL